MNEAMSFTNIDMANARIRVLERTLATLPRTADGEIVTLGSTVYRLYAGHLGNGSRYVTEETVSMIDKWGGIHTDETGEPTICSDIYSSREMAEANVSVGCRITFKTKRKRRTNRE